jgi:hypothetical protein
LEPFQTVAVDIKQFQTSQAADIRKKTFPTNVTSGKIIWYERTGGSLSGRAETADFSAGIAGSFSCGGSCSCGMQTTSAYMDPYSFFSVVGDHGYPFTPMEMLEDCNGDYDYGPYAITSGLTWNSSNSSIATVGYYNGYVECMSAGTCNINFTYNAVYVYDGDYSCNPYYNNFYGSGQIIVNPAVSIDNSFIAVGKNYSEEPSIPEGLAISRPSGVAKSCTRASINAFAPPCILTSANALPVANDSLIAPNGPLGSAATMAKPAIAGAFNNVAHSSAVKFALSAIHFCCRSFVC